MSEDKKEKFYDPGVRIEEVPLLTFDKNGKIIKVWRKNLFKVVKDLSRDIKRVFGK